MYFFQCGVTKMLGKKFTEIKGKQKISDLNCLFFLFVMMICGHSANFGVYVLEFLKLFEYERPSFVANYATF